MGLGVSFLVGLGWRSELGTVYVREQFMCWRVVGWCLIPGVARREQGAIAAKISNVQVQDYLPGEAGH